MKGLNIRLVLIPLLFAVSVSSYADGGVSTDYSPYSKYGFGLVQKPGTSYTRSMGGVGVALRDNKFINILNPAAVTARDSLAFMADISIRQDNIFYTQGSLSSVHNNFDINSFVMSFPIWRSSAFMIGITPITAKGYDFVNTLTDKSVIAEAGTINDYFTGTGSLYNFFFGAGATFWKRFSVGAQLNFIFGTLTQSDCRLFTDETQRDIYKVNDLAIRGVSGKFGIQYEQKLGGRHSLILGATYSTQAYLGGNGDLSTYTLQSDVVDTMSFKAINIGGVNIPQEFSVGLSYKWPGKMKAEFDYTRSDWRHSGLDETDGFSCANFSASVSQSFNFGMEWIPNVNDVRYYMKRCSYRIGFYYTDEYFKYRGNTVSTYGLTLGITFPVFRWHNGLSVGMELGQRGNLQNNMVREQFVNFSFGINLFDIWFVKPKYE